jgi:hypothetical protein
MTDCKKSVSLDSLTVAQIDKLLPPFMKIYGSLPFSQEFSTECEPS